MLSIYSHCVKLILIARMLFEILCYGTFEVLVDNLLGVILTRVFRYGEDAVRYTLTDITRT